MANGLANGFSVDEVVGAYAEMESLLRSARFSQDEKGLLAAVLGHLDGADSASISELRDNQFLTLAATDQGARDGDALQYELRSGPCVDAIVQQTVFAPIDLLSDLRWPVFGKQVAATLGYHSMLSLRLLSDATDSIYGLNVYGRKPHAFDRKAVLFGLLVGTYASSVVFSSATSTTILNLEKALETNRQIGMAVGVIMATYRLTPERSFEILRLTSMNRNRKLRDVAEAVVTTGLSDLDV